ncbi:MAG TPA: family 78 glycoside hydrolase catalytic domain, partial [Prolixibacteraceae bacterium]|nr:family 78 glycoside hydrolase catalytic domain [Prolixibacteraceae bacterium]
MIIRAQDKGEVTVADLRCCNMTHAEGIDSPLLGWKIYSAKEGISQTAWEAEIASGNDLLLKGRADVWKSGKRQSDEQFNIEPDGIRLADATGYYWRVRIWDNDGKASSWSTPAYFSTGLKDHSWKAKWITYPNPENSALPYFRKVFNTSKANAVPVRAMAYLCGLGCSELYMNGKKVDSTRFLDPAQTNYEQYALYSTFDVTNLLKAGDNCIGVMLGKGWFSQDTAWKGANFSYGNPMLRIQVEVLYSDGSRTVTGSDESWSCKGGPVIQSNLYLGESYDARQETKGWCLADTPCSDWDKALPATENIPPRLFPSVIEPIRTKQVLKAVKMWQDNSGNWIFDFGVNISGVPMLNVRQPAGTRLAIRLAEEKKEDGSLDFTTMGWIHHGKIFQDDYICKGEGTEQWSPRFSYHGFRYAELSGMKDKPDLSALSLVVVHSDLVNSGTFECADSQVNKLHELALRTVLSNLHGIPTDCPDREKCGWLGDSHAYV